MAGRLFLFRTATALESIAARRSFALARVAPLRTAIPLAVFVALAGCTAGNAAAEFWRGTVAWCCGGWMRRCSTGWTGVGSSCGFLPC
jgi:hypothetical protein